MSLLIHTHMLNSWKGTRLHHAQASPERLFLRRGISASSEWQMRHSVISHSLILLWITTQIWKQKYFSYMGGGWQQGSLFYTFSDPSLCLLQVHFTLCPDKSNTPLLQSTTRILVASGREGFETNKTIYAIQEIERVKGINPATINEWKR